MSTKLQIRNHKFTMFWQIFQINGYFLYSTLIMWRTVQTTFVFSKTYEIISQQVFYCFRTFVKEEVEDGEVGKETVALSVDLVVRLRREERVCLFGFRGDDVTVVKDGLELVGGDEFLGEIEGNVEVEELAEETGGGHVIVEEVGMADGGCRTFIDEEGADVVPVVLEEGGLAIGGAERLPMEVAPVAVVGDADVLDEVAAGVCHGDGEGLCAVGSGYDTAVAVGLFLEGFPGFYGNAGACATAQE